MSVAAVSSTPAHAPASSPTATAATARSADGDYKVRSAQTSQIKDADGDYKPLTSSAAAQSSPSVQASVTSLKKGG
jgi:hypothetical protein